MSAGPLEGLPKQFVHAMRTLFDIMDDKKTGFVRFTEIENRWRDDGTKGLPKGVIESLRKVTPPNGLLSFERFCTGLKICLLKNQKVEGKLGEEQTSRPSRPPSAPLLDLDEPKTPKKAVPWVQRQNYAHRTVSMPQLVAKESNEEQPLPKAITQGPPKPPRLSLGANAGAIERGIDKLEIRTALQNWQMGIIQADNNKKNLVNGYSSLGRNVGRSLGDGKPSGQMENALQTHRKPGGRRRDPRRHTLQNGIDYNMLRRMKQLEQEKEVLLQGLQAVERARDWYLQQLAALNDKMHFLGRDATYHSEQWSEAQMERLGMQRARVQEVNRQLAALTDPSVPLHMNLAVGNASENYTSRLKQQNHLLSEEVHKKGEIITALEREKASLIRELFQARAQQELPVPCTSSSNGSRGVRRRKLFRRCLWHTE
ncbi:suppressor APC domain-containing protein 2 [Neocloeon triangulifer]|uniref:suppressor APC domain-containing protein 2 n=1 Tax=Neocloeon triangulifer TaxID=2078957 RepID=UPI00286F45AB|nr:suppressor APC domain-containing protein 2 [Neocloeon triangulifer]